mgnify:CR=1 FL=1
MSLENDERNIGRDLERASQQLDMAKGSLVVGDRENAMRLLDDVEETMKRVLRETSVRDGSPLRFTWDDEGNLWENYPLIV